MVKDGRALKHPAAKQHQEIHPMVLSEKIRFMVPQKYQSAALNEPDTEMTHEHVLSSLAERAANVEQTIAQGITTVRICSRMYLLNNFD